MNDLMNPASEAAESGTYPKVFFSLLDRMAPRIINNPDEEAGLDLVEWTTIPPQARAAGDLEFPAVYYNINVPAVIIRNAAELAQLGGSFVRLDLTGVFEPVPPAV
jgi:hypothetical protein